MNSLKKSSIYLRNRGLFGCLIIVMLVGVTILFAGCTASKGKLYICNFGDYIDPKLIGEFTKETGIEVVYSTFDTNEELYPIINKHMADYDVICTSDYMAHRLKEEGLLKEFDKENIPNLSNILPQYMKQVSGFDKNGTYVVPHTFGILGIMYDKRKISYEKVHSWRSLWSQELKDDIVMLDSMRDTMGIGLKALGYDINTKNKKEIKEASSYLRKQKKIVYKYANDATRDLVLGGSASVGVLWSGEYAYAREISDDVGFVVPEEGTETFVDCWALPKWGKNKEAAEKWINFMLSKSSAIKNYEYLGYTIPNKYVYEYVKKEGELDDELMGIIFPSQETLDKGALLQYLGQEADHIYSEYWKLFKTN